MSPAQIPRALREGRRALEGMKGVSIVEDFKWDAELQRWILHCRITLDSESEFVPRSTDWYVLVEPSYPWGYIRFYPAKEGGLKHTFPHQQYNEDSSSKYPFRTGFLCLDTSVYVIGRHDYDRQPFEAHERLRWHMEAAIEWLTDGQEEQLLRSGDHYELPQFPHSTDTSLLVGFTEDEASFARWNSIQEKCGLVILDKVGEKPDVYVATSFQSTEGVELIRPSWGRAINSIDKPHKGIWIRLPSVPIIAPWQAPSTWAELRDACEEQGVSLYDVIGSCSAKIRDGGHHFALFGFPISKKVGEEPSHLHWQAIRLPILSWKKNSSGFRTTASGYLDRDRSLVLQDAEHPQWVITENWNTKEISTRGKLPDNLTSKHVLIIGAGALGSVLAEMLVRAGVHRMTILEHDSLEMGNLTRHTLHMGDVKRLKADAVAERLSLVSPHANIDSIATAFPPQDPDDIAQVQSADIVIDTTAQDGILHHLEAFPWGNEKLFFSFSFGMKARKIYCYASQGSTFPMTDFRTQINPYITQDKQEFEATGEELPMEGTGCWHRLFPARIDDVWLLTPIALKFMEGMMANVPASPSLKAYEQIYGDHGFEGISLINP